MIPERPHAVGGGTLGRALRLHRDAATRFRRSSPTTLDIGLVNNMPDAALNATVRQFRTLLGSAADDIIVRLSLFTLPEVPRSDFGREQVSSYLPFESLWATQLDGLIVTGTEPRAEDLREEPYWHSFERVVEWAETHTYSTVLSCLAAHAGVLHFDGIVRQRLDDKRFGVFEGVRVCDHPLTAAAPSRLQMPHSRWNEIPEETLVSRGYRVLTRLDGAGVDAFVKQRTSLFVFFQGHPEYDANALMLEYRRDIGRFLRGERDTYPSLPHGYFEGETVQALTAFRDRALVDRRAELLAEFPIEMANKVTSTWRLTAEHLYRNWLLYIRAQKERGNAEKDAAEVA